MADHISQFYVIPYAYITMETDKCSWNSICMVITVTCPTCTVLQRLDFQNAKNQTKKNEYCLQNEKLDSYDNKKMILKEHKQ